MAMNPEREKKRQKRPLKKEKPMREKKPPEPVKPSAAEEKRSRDGSSLKISQLSDEEKKMLVKEKVVALPA